MKQILVVLGLIVHVGVIAQQIDGYEYWIDNDFANRTSVTLTNPQEDVTISFTNDVTNLPNGMHYFNVRFRSSGYADGEVKWGTVQTDCFLKWFINTGENQIVQYQYWFDNDFDNKTTYNLMGLVKDTTISNYISVENLSNGIHCYNIRFQDALGNWSTVQSDYFLKNEVNEADINQIVKYEYWLDENSNEKNTVILDEPKLDVTIDFTVNISALSLGTHKLNTEFTDTKGASVLQTDYFTLGETAINNLQFSNVFVYPNPTTDIIHILLQESCFIQIYNSIGELVAENASSSIEHTVNLSNQPQGVYYIHIRNKEKHIVRQIIKLE